MYTVPLGYVQNRPTGEIKSIVVDGIESLEPTLAHVIPEMTANIIVPTFVIAYMIVLDWRIGLIGLAVVPLGLVLMMLAFKNYDVNFQKQAALSSKVNAALVEFVNGLEVIKVFNQDAQSYRRFKDAAEENAGFSIAWMNEIAPAAASAQVIMGASLLFVLPAGLFFMAQGTLETTVFLQLIVLTLSWVGPIVAAFKYPDQISAVRSTARRVFAVVNENDLVRPDSSSAARDASISLEDVCFSYDAENAEVLHGINLTLDEGCKLALVGPSGGGKSTKAKSSLSGCFLHIKDDDLPEIDLAKTDGYVVDGTDEDDPSLIMPDGSPVQTWRERTGHSPCGWPRLPARPTWSP